MSADEPEELAADFAPWQFWAGATDRQRADQTARSAELRARGFTVGQGCVVSRLAAVHPQTFSLGDRSYVAAHAHVSGDVVIGADCSVNVAAAVRGTVRTGRAVRIGAHTSILGFDHVFADTEVEVFRQPLRSRGVTIGDDVWIGSHVVVLDGVRIGSHAVVGAGAVVTKDVPEWAVAVGNPARVVRDRRSGVRRASRPDRLTRLTAFGATARAEVGHILETAWGGGAYRDPPTSPPSVRAHTDAVELADLLLGGPPPQLSPDEHVSRLRAAQDAGPRTVGELVADQDVAYHVLCVGYALDLLGARFEHPVLARTGATPADLVTELDGLPWTTNAWGAGALVDSIGTALTWALRGGHAVAPGVLEALVGWLVLNRNPASGLWGASADGLRDPVNGTYRALRGTAAQWGLRLGADDHLTDSVLLHAPTVVGSPAGTACDALDVVHLLHRGAAVLPDYRRGEVDDVARAVLEGVVDAWSPGLGIPFSPGLSPSLKGTEMWLATAWYAADLLGESDALGYRPRGVHRPEPAIGLSAQRPG